MKLEPLNVIVTVAFLPSDKSIHQINVTSLKKKLPIIAIIVSGVAKLDLTFGDIC